MVMIAWDEQERRPSARPPILQEEPYINVGEVQAVLGKVLGTVAVVEALLVTEGVSVISMRPASRKERSLL